MGQNQKEAIDDPGSIVVSEFEKIIRLPSDFFVPIQELRKAAFRLSRLDDHYFKIGIRPPLVPNISPEEIHQTISELRGRFKAFYEKTFGAFETEELRPIRREVEDMADATWEAIELKTKIDELYCEITRKLYEQSDVQLKTEVMHDLQTGARREMVPEAADAFELLVFDVHHSPLPKVKYTVEIRDEKGELASASSKKFYDYSYLITRFAKMYIANMRMAASAQRIRERTRNSDRTMQLNKTMVKLTIAIVVLTFAMMVLSAILAWKTL